MNSGDYLKFSRVGHTDTYFPTFGGMERQRDVIHHEKVSYIIVKNKPYLKEYKGINKSDIFVFIRIFSLDLSWTDTFHVLLSTLEAATRPMTVDEKNEVVIDTTIKDLY